MTHDSHTHHTIHVEASLLALTMVDIQELPSSSSSVSSSSVSSDSSSSSSSDSSSAPGSKKPVIGSQAQEFGGKKCRQEHQTHDNNIMSTATNNHVQATVLQPTSGNQDRVPVETVVCVKKTSPVGQDENMPPASNNNDDDDDDFPYFHSDESLPSVEEKIPPLPLQKDPFDDNGLSDEALAKLLDSPEVLEKTRSHNNKTNTTTTSAMEVNNKKNVYESPSISSSIDSDDLEIPHSCTPPPINKSSRFFENEHTTKTRQSQQATHGTAGKPLTNAVSQGHDETTMLHHSTVQQAAPLQDATTSIPIMIQQQDTPPRLAEVDPFLYKPIPYQQRPDPIVHSLTLQNRPMHTRQQVPVSRVFPSPLHKLWHFQHFNHLQTEVANILADSDDSIVVSAPTGAGKTALFEISIMRFLSTDLRRNGGVLSHQGKIVYIAPSKALCEERYNDWTRRLSSLGLGVTCSIITGDAEPGDSYRDVASSHIILTTPEKWDSLTRRWTENVYLFGSVKVLLLDEVHLLGDGSRGACLESMVTRMKTIQRAAVAVSGHYDSHSSSSYPNTSREALSSYLRIVAVSATLPNVSSIAAFLEANEAYAFDASYRPVPLETHVVGLGHVTNPFMFAKNMDRHVPDLIKRFSKNKPTIIFCHTKKDTETLAMELSKIQGIGIPNNGRDTSLASQTNLTSLQGPLMRGIAYHHAGLDASDRKLVETAFSDGKVKVLCATSTLAMGVNLPAHLVMIKGTRAWRGTKQGYREIESGTLLQMMGRAGRPGFDTSGTAIIMTDNASKTKYEQLSGGMEVVESQLPARLMDVLSVEISQRVITSFESAQDWMRSTFFFRRVTENPRQYGWSSSEYTLDEFTDKVCLESLESLSATGLIRFDDSGNIAPLAGCHIYSQNMIDFITMKRIVGLPFDADQAAILKVLAECERLHRPVRRGEKKALNEVHKLIRYKLDGPPSKVRIQTPTEKAFVLLQAAIGQHYLEDITLRQEMSFMVEYATRILSAVEEYSIDGSKHGQVALQSLRLRRSLATSLWGVGDGVLNQLRGVGHKTTAKLRFSKISSFMDVIAASSENIERAAGREPPFGTELRRAVSKILINTLQLSACVESEAGVPTFVVCNLDHRQAIPGIEHVESDGSAGLVKYTLVVYTDRPGGSLVFHPNISSAGEYRLPCPPTCGKIFVHCIASMVGLDERLTLDGSDAVLESAFSTKPSDKKKRKRIQPAAAAAASLSPQGGTDARIKRKPAGKRKAKQQSTYASSSKKQRSAAPKQAPSRATAPAAASSAKSVTPSPPPPSASATNTAPASASHHAQPNPQNNHDPPSFRATATGTSSQRLLGHRNNSNWQQEKQTHKSMQRSAFRHKKDNPFSSYSYDPNDMESSLVASAEKSLSPVVPRSLDDRSTSVLPSKRLSEMRQASAIKTATRSFIAGGSGRKVRRSGGTAGRGRRRRTFPQVDSRELLHMKAMEQQAYDPPQRRQQHFNPIMQEDEYEQQEDYLFSGERHTGHYTRNSLYAPDPNGWNDYNDGMVTQTQAHGFLPQSQYMNNEAANRMSYEQAPRNDGYGLYSSHPSSAFQQVSQTQHYDYRDADPWGRQAAPFENMQRPPPMPSRAFAAPQMSHQPSYDEEEEDALFSAAFG